MPVDAETDPLDSSCLIEHLKIRTLWFQYWCLNKNAYKPCSSHVIVQVTVFLPQLVQSLRGDKDNSIGSFLKVGAMRSSYFAHILLHILTVWHLPAGLSHSCPVFCLVVPHDIARLNQKTSHVRQPWIDSLRNHWIPSLV